MKERNLKNRKALIEESLIEFGSLSYENASLNNIIKRAKVSKGSFYYHFENKEDLYLQLLNEGVQEKWKFITAYTAEHAIAFNQIDIFDKFLYQAKAGLQFAEAYPEYSRLSNMFAKEKGTEIYEKVLITIGDTSRDLLKSMIHDAYKSGEISQSYNLDFVERLLSELFTRFDEFFIDHGSIEQRIKNLEDFVHFLKNGLSQKQ